MSVLHDLDHALVRMASSQPSPHLPSSALCLCPARLREEELDTAQHVAELEASLVKAKVELAQAFFPDFPLPFSGAVPFSPLCRNRAPCPCASTTFPSPFFPLLVCCAPTAQLHFENEAGQFHNEQLVEHLHKHHRNSGSGDSIGRLPAPPVPHHSLKVDDDSPKRRGRKSSVVAHSAAVRDHAAVAVSKGQGSTRRHSSFLR